jgi:hypothetical protein
LLCPALDRGSSAGRTRRSCYRGQLQHAQNGHVHFTPTYGSWISLVERRFAELTNKRIRRGVFRSVKELESAIREYIDVHNEDPTPFVWTKTADQILASIARYARRTMAAHPA